MLSSLARLVDDLSSLQKGEHLQSFVEAFPHCRWPHVLRGADAVLDRLQSKDGTCYHRRQTNIIMLSEQE
jgi:hypothetical protein